MEKVLKKHDTCKRARAHTHTHTYTNTLTQ